MSVGDEPVLAVIEHEDEWFGLVRVDGDEEPRLFVSDLARRRHLSLRSACSPRPRDVDSAEDVDVAEADDDDEGEDDEDDEPKIAAWAGETDLLEDLGVSGRTLRKLVEENGDDPGARPRRVGETVGFVELLDALR